MCMCMYIHLYIASHVYTYNTLSLYIYIYIYIYHYIKHFTFYPFVHQRTPQLFAYLCYCYNAAINMGIQISHCDNDFASLYIYVEMGLLDHMVLLSLIIEEVTYCFHSGCISYIPTNSAKDFSFLYIFINTFYLLPF